MKFELKLRIYKTLQGNSILMTVINLICIFVELDTKRGVECKLHLGPVNTVCFTCCIVCQFSVGPTYKVKWPRSLPVWRLGERRVRGGVWSNTQNYLYTYVLQIFIITRFVAIFHWFHVLIIWIIARKWIRLKI